MANRLKNESSAYLLQHAENPVDWYPWGDEAFARAREENKLVLVSIGYSACHWCHVMERETFADEEIAALMNQYYICIKVDREERPDVDQVYMDAVQQLTGNGGWPLNVFLLPDARPVTGGTYFPPARWREILLALEETYRKEPVLLFQYAGRMEEAMTNEDRLRQVKQEKPFDQFLPVNLMTTWKKQFDTVHGGYLGVPKFILPGSLGTLFKYVAFTEDPEIIQHLDLSLEKISLGGIHDHVGGGFARYSVDEAWHVPHFEKMLYDNTQILSLFAEAYHVNRNEQFRQVAMDTFEFLVREMRDPGDGFYSSYDADSEGEEGKYYVWSYDEFMETIGADNVLLSGFFQLRKEGNWEGRNILHAVSAPLEYAARMNLSQGDFIEKLSRGKKSLYAARSKRIKPGLDDKILTAWNAMMVSSLARSSMIISDQRMLNAALNAMDYLLHHHWQEPSTIIRTTRKKLLPVHGFLDDYAFVIEACMALYQVTFDESWLQKARNITETTIERFYDPQASLFNYSPDPGSLPGPAKKEITDQVIPSSNAVMAMNLFMLGNFYYEDKYLLLSSSMLRVVLEDLRKYPLYHYKWMELLLYQVHGIREVVVVGPEADRWLKRLVKLSKPGMIFAGSSKPSSLPVFTHRYKEGKTLAYLCHNRVCQAPLENLEEVMAALSV
jgi:uncharacterized protein YyaL (SSP411 family)